MFTAINLSVRTAFMHSISCDRFISTFISLDTSFHFWFFFGSLLVKKLCYLTSMYLFNIHVLPTTIMLSKFHIPTCFLLPISSFISLLVIMIPDMISVLLKCFKTCFVFQHRTYPGKCSILTWEEWILWYCWMENFIIFVRLIWSVAFFKSIVSFIIFCLNNVSDVENGVLKSDMGFQSPMGYCCLFFFLCSSFSHVWLSVTPWTIACQVPLSMEFSRKEYRSGLLFPSAGGLPDPQTDPGPQALWAEFFLPSEPPRKPWFFFFFKFW